MTKFQVVADQDYGVWLVREVSNAYSFSMIPTKHRAEFESKAQAFEQVRRLHNFQEKGNVIELSHSETPGCFEAVADKKYGVEW